jgi:hypothetical protein
MNTNFRHLIALGLLAAAGLAQAADAPAAPAAGASAAAPKPHVTARAMQERSAKFAACRKTALDQGLQGEELKQSLVTCMQ